MQPPTRQLSPAFAMCNRFVLAVSRCRKAVLSIPALDEAPDRLENKDLLSAGPVSTAAKHTLAEHLERAAAEKSIDPDRPALVIGLRNSLVNPRAIVIQGGRMIAAEGERPDVSTRPYYGIAWNGDRFSAELVLPSDPRQQRPEVFFSGIPVLWDSIRGEELFDQLLTEAADHSHVFDLPRGNHPLADGESQDAWSSLNKIFRAHLHADGERAARAMREAIRSARYPLRRCSTYLHSVLGVDGDGRLINVVAHGLLERVGRIAAEAGCHRAICVENSGSIMPTLLPRGLLGEPLPLLRAPNFRPKGRVLLLIELESKVYSTLEMTEGEGPVFAQASTRGRSPR